MGSCCSKFTKQTNKPKQSIQQQQKNDEKNKSSSMELIDHEEIIVNVVYDFQVKKSKLKNKSNPQNQSKLIKEHQIELKGKQTIPHTIPIMEKDFEDEQDSEDSNSLENAKFISQEKSKSIKEHQIEMKGKQTIPHTLPIMEKDFEGLQDSEDSNSLEKAKSISQENSKSIKEHQIELKGKKTIPHTLPIVNEDFEDLQDSQDSDSQDTSEFISQDQSIKNEWQHPIESNKKTISNTIRSFRNTFDIQSYQENEYPTLGSLMIKAFPKGKAFGQYNHPDYKAISEPVILYNQIIYQIKPLSKTEYKGDLELRVVTFKELSSFNLYLYGLIQYMNNLQNFKGRQGIHTPSDVKALLESFKKVFQFFSKPDISIKNQFLLLIVQERLTSLESFLDSLLTNPLSDQVEKLNYLFCNLSQNIDQLSSPLQCGFGNLKQFTEIILDNMFYREQSEYDSFECKTNEIAVLSYPKVNTFSQEQIDDDDEVYNFILVQNSSWNVFQVILSYLKQKGSRIMKQLLQSQKKPLVVDQEIKPLFKEDDVVQTQFNTNDLFYIGEEGKVFDKLVLYSNVIKVVYSNNKPQRADQTLYQIKEIHCKNQDDYELVLKSVDQYRKGYDSIEPGKKEYFQVVHDHWGQLKNNVVYAMEVQKKECRSVKDDLLQYGFQGINYVLFRLFELAFNNTLKSQSSDFGFNIDAVQYFNKYQNPQLTLSFNYTQFEEKQQEKELEMITTSKPKNSFSFLKNMYDIVNFTSEYYSQDLTPILKTKFNLKINKNENVLKEYEKHEKLGESQYPVFRITHLKTKNEYALKELKVQKFVQISSTYIESQLALLFPNDLTLLQIKDIFLQHDKNDKKSPFKMSIIMEKAIGDAGIMGQKGQSFKKFYPLFKDSILAVSFMHSKNIAHRDIKPGNILVVLKDGKKKFLMADYGEGTNLNYKEQFLDDPNYHIGKFGVAGTPTYMDPSLFSIYQNFLKNQKTNMNTSKSFDILKADIYSLGITLVKIAIGLQSKELVFNRKPKNDKKIFKMIHKLNYPIQIRQCLIMMTKYHSKDRIPTVALYNNLENIMNELEIGLSYYQKMMKLQQKEYMLYKELIDKKSLFRFEQVLGQRAKVKIYEFREKLRNITKNDKSFSMNDYFIAYKDSKLEKNQVVLLKPCYIPCYIQKVNNEDSFTIIFNGSKKRIKASQAISIKSCIYKKDQFLEYWAQELKQWVLCQIIEVNLNKQTYLIKLKYGQEEEKIIPVPFFSLKLKRFLFFENPEEFYKNPSFMTLKIRDDEKYLFMSDRPLINYKQLMDKKINLNEGGRNQSNINKHQN